jgi:hypothetical protein
MQGLSLFGESAGDEENEFLRLQVGESIELRHIQL